MWAIESDSLDAEGAVAAVAMAVDRGERNVEGVVAGDAENGCVMSERPFRCGELGGENGPGWVLVHDEGERGQTDVLVGWKTGGRGVSDQHGAEEMEEELQSSSADEGREEGACDAWGPWDGKGPWGF
jgi:hypothetical protein